MSLINTDTRINHSVVRAELQAHEKHQHPAGKSDGTQRIWKLNPSTLEEEDYIETVTDRSVFNKANELEYVGGKIYANVWQKESMMIIDAQTGAIEGVVNFGGLSKEVTQHRDLDVFNGVAYHKGRQTFFVTGKNWDKLFEVRIVKRDR
jgi:glutamine cyclotransferase